MATLFWSWARKMVWQISNHPKHAWLFAIPVSSGAFVAWAAGLIANGSGKSVQQWLQDRHLPSLLTLLVAALVITCIAVVGVTRCLVSEANAELPAIKPQFDKLTIRQRELLNALLPSGRSFSAIVKNNETDLEYICEHTAFLKRDGSDYELNGHARKVLSLLSKLDKSTRKQWYETPENELTGSSGETVQPSLTSLLSSDPLDGVRLAEVRSEWGKLTTEQQGLLGRILVSGGLNWDQVDVGYWESLPMYSDFQLSNYLLKRSTLLEHRSKGNADLRRYIQSRKEGKTDFILGRRTWKVKAEFIDTLRQIMAEPVTATTGRLPEQPELDIAFDGSQPEFVDPTKVEKLGVIWACKLYRVTVTSHSSSPVTRLLAKGVKNTTEGRTYPPLHLRITGKNDSKRKSDYTGESLNSGMWLKKKMRSETGPMPRETDIPGGHILRVPGEFLITASCEDGLNVTKRVVLDSKENGDLDFRLADSYFTMPSFS